MTAAKRDTCLWCRSPSTVEAHHLTGKRADHTYPHPDLTVPLCKKHHDLAHADLRAQRIDDPATTPLDTIQAVAHWLARIATFLGRHSRTHTQDWLGRIADALQGMAEALLQACTALTPAV